MKYVSIVLTALLGLALPAFADTNKSAKPLLKDKSRYEKSVDKMLKDKQKERNKTEEQHKIKRRKDGTIDTYQYFNK